MSTSFAVVQRFVAPVDDVERAFVDPGFYDALAALPNLGQPDVLSLEVDGDMVHLRVRYRFMGHLSAAARAVLDPARLTWVDDSWHDLAAHTVRYRMVADHYADRFDCAGTYTFEPDGDGTVRRANGEVTVRARFVGGSVERAIISGMEAHLDEEVAILDQWVAGAGAGGDRPPDGG